LPETADRILIDKALVELEFGLMEASKATLNRMHLSDTGSPSYAQLRSELGDISSAEHFLSTHASLSSDTLLMYVDVPRIRGVMALHPGKPMEAIAALEVARPNELRDYKILSVRARAYLLAGQPKNAIREYNKIIANPGLDPTSVFVL